VKHWRNKEQIEAEVLLEKLANQVIGLYLKNDGDLDAVFEALQRRGWKVSEKNRGMVYNPFHHRRYTFLCHPASIEASQDSSEFLAPLWGKHKHKGGGKDIRLPRSKWEELLKPVWR